MGRFAPSPTGPLHFGSLLAATTSYLQAKVNGGEWHLRIDDLDGPRCDEKWNQPIFDTLECYGFEWHGEIVYQSQRLDAYVAAIDQLMDQRALFNCDCSRRKLAKTATSGDSGLIYPGHCQSNIAGTDNRPEDHALRLTVNDAVVDFDDGWQGRQQRHLGRDDGDFVIWRRDGLPAYHLAVVVDDAAIGVTESVRGVDLLTSTPKQIFLQQQLGLSTPGYRHFGIAVTSSNDKISKFSNAPALDLASPAITLYAALQTLQQQPPPQLQQWPIAECWQWAIENWQPKRLSGIQKMVITNPAFAGETTR